MQSLLVTGGAGFIGSNFVRYMLKKYPSYRIIVLDALTYAGNRENLADLEKNPRYLFYHGNICDRAIVDNLVSNVDAVINFAAETHVDRSIHEADSFVQTDVLGTLILLEAAKKYKIERYLQSQPMKYMAPSKTALSRKSTRWPPTALILQAKPEAT